MLFKTTVGLLIVLIGCSGNQQATKDKCLTENLAQQQVKFKSGLRIENGINRGTGYTDSLGTQYNIRYIPITITNDSSTSIQLEISFSRKYNNSIVSSCEHFNVIPMPVQWGMDGVEITESMISELPKYINKPMVSKILEPDEKFLFAIGTRYLRSSSCVGPLPNALFTLDDNVNFQTCDYAINQVDSTEPGLALGLRLDYNRGKSDESCMIIPCGSISYLGL